MIEPRKYGVLILYYSVFVLAFLFDLGFVFFVESRTKLLSQRISFHNKLLR